MFKRWYYSQIICSKISIFKRVMRKKIIIVRFKILFEGKRVVWGAEPPSRRRRKILESNNPLDQENFEIEEGGFI